MYGLELKPSEWHSTEGHALRVEKPIRMRVHRKCHLCSTSFGLGKECPKCKHPRCKQCPRVPPKRTEAEKEESRKKRAAIIKERAEKAPIIPDWDPTPKTIVLKRPAKAGGQDLYYRKPRQRIRRNCCQCKVLFTGSKTCDGCQHVRCTDCPRDPYVISVPHSTRTSADPLADPRRTNIRTAILEMLQARRWDTTSVPAASTSSRRRPQTNPSASSARTTNATALPPERWSQSPTPRS